MQPEYLLLPQTLPDGGSQNLMLDVLGNLRVTQGGKYAHVASATTTLVKTGPGTLRSITVNTTAAGAITVYDAVTAVAPVIAILKSSIAEGTYTFDVNFTTGLTIVTAAASDITVSYN